MERNLHIVKAVPSIPTRSCRYSTGPPSWSFTASAVTSSSGRVTSSPVAAITRSKARLSAYLAPENCGVSTAISGSPSTGRQWMRGPATSVRRLVSTSCTSVPSNCHESWRRNLRSVGTSSATITVRMPVSSSRSMIRSQRRRFGSRVPSERVSPSGASGSAHTTAATR